MQEITEKNSQFHDLSLHQKLDYSIQVSGCDPEKGVSLHVDIGESISPTSVIFLNIV